MSFNVLSPSTMQCFWDLSTSSFQKAVRVTKDKNLVSLSLPQAWIPIHGDMQNSLSYRYCCSKFLQKQQAPRYTTSCAFSWLGPG